MNILFLTIGRIEDVDEESIYLDLLRTFRDNGHSVYCVSPNERRSGKDTTYTVEKGMRVLRVRTGNIKKCNIIEKGISTILIEPQYRAAVKKYMGGVKFDLILYSTPPITLAGVIKYVKRRDNATTYLMLKDIFPQNAIDIGMMKKDGLKGLIYKYFRKKEKKLYAISDKIGCMSQANCDYVLRHNPEISSERVEVCPNAISVREMIVTGSEKLRLREKYGLPIDKRIFVYGGNLGRPQGIPYIVECLDRLKDSDAFFFIVGDGTEYGKLKTFIDEKQPLNVKLQSRIPREDYNRIVAACDVGMIFLDHRFTIPNFPSRLLSYMQAGLPVLACTDPNTDVGQVIVDGGFGWWCESCDVDAFAEIVDKALKADLSEMRDNARAFLNENYTVDRAYDVIIKANK